MAGRWSNHERSLFREMWLCGVDEDEIAKTIGRTARAVRGRAQTAGLLARRGTGLVAVPVVMALRRAVADQLGEYASEGTEDVARIVMALVAGGRQCRCLTTVSKVDARRARPILRAMSELGIWPVAGGPPARWWQEGPDGVRTDIARIAAASKSEDQRHAA